MKRYEKKRKNKVPAESVNRQSQSAGLGILAKMIAGSLYNSSRLSETEPVTDSDKHLRKHKNIKEQKNYSG
jgi:hypothetical protein